MVTRNKIKGQDKIAFKINNFDDQISMKIGKIDLFALVPERFDSLID